MEKETRVLILAGGKGTRLSSVVSDVPKPIAPLGKIPFMEFLVKKLEGEGLRNITILTGYKAEVIHEYFKDDSKFGVKIEYSYEDTPLGTRGAIKQAIKTSGEDNFLILNKNTFFDIDFNKFVKESEHNTNITLYAINDYSQYDVVETENDLVIKFHEKIERVKNKPINTEVYLTDKKVCEMISEGFCSLENEVFPKLLENKNLEAKIMRERFINISIPEDYYRAEKLLKD